jgi:hypothetical protein
VVRPAGSAPWLPEFMKLPRSFEPSIVMVTSKVVSRPTPGWTRTLDGALTLTAPFSMSFWNRKVGVTLKVRRLLS